MSGPAERNDAEHSFSQNDADASFESKIELEDARVYVHKEDAETRSRVLPSRRDGANHSNHGLLFEHRHRRCDAETASQFRVIHIDVEHEDLNEIIASGENTFCGGKDGGVFIGLKDEMQDTPNRNGSRVQAPLRGCEQAKRYVEAQS